MKIVRWLFVIILILCLVFVRVFEDDLFYDPLLSFFHTDYLSATFPSFDLGKHLVSITLRYILNVIISLGIIYFIFKDLRIVKFSGLLMLALVAPFLLLYAYFIHIEFQGFFTAGFYVRRLLLQPIILLILIPSIWFYKNQPTQKVD